MYSFTHPRLCSSAAHREDGSFVRFPFELDLSQWLAGPPTEEGLGTAARPDMFPDTLQILFMAAGLLHEEMLRGLDLMRSLHCSGALIARACQESNTSSMPL